MKKRTLLILAVLVVVLIASIALYRSVSIDLSVSVPNTVINDRIPYDVTVSSNKETIVPGDFARYRFVVKENGQLAPLIANLIYPHVAVVSDDLSDITFYHVDRLASPHEGIYEFDHQYTADSDYTLWFELNDNTTEDHHGKNSNYISRVKVPIVGTKETTAPTVVKTTAIDREYHLRLESGTLQAGKPGEVRIFVENADGSPAEILQDYEQHFYYIAQPATGYYILDHFDEHLADPSSVAAQLTLPEPGTYALWGRIFIGDGTGSAIDLTEGGFTIQVR